MIELHVNGENRQLPQPLSIQAALQHWGYTGDDIAVAVNGEFVPRSQYPNHQLDALDQVDIVAPIQGG